MLQIWSVEFSLPYYFVQTKEELFTYLITVSLENSAQKISFLLREPAKSYFFNGRTNKGGGGGYEESQEEKMIFFWNIKKFLLIFKK